MHYPPNFPIMNISIKLMISFTEPFDVISLKIDFSVDYYHCCNEWRV